MRSRTCRRSRSKTTLRARLKPFECRPFETSPITASPGPHAAAVDEAASLHDPQREPGQVVLALGVEVWQLRDLAADQGAAGLPAARGDPANDGLDEPRHDPVDPDVIEEHEGLRPVDEEVVDPHGHQVDPDGVVPAGQERDPQLGPDAVRRRHEYGLAVRAGERGRSPAKAPMSPSTSGRYVARAHGASRRTASSPASMSTPAAR